MQKIHIPYRFGFIGVKKDFITPENVIKALEIQFEENVSEEKHRLIGEIMVESGFMEPSQVNAVLEEMTGKGAPNKESYRKRFGDLATAKGYVSLGNFKGAMEVQIREENNLGRHRPIGEILIERGHMDISQTNEIIEELL